MPSLRRRGAVIQFQENPTSAAAALQQSLQELSLYERLVETSGKNCHLGGLKKHTNLLTRTPWIRFAVRLLHLHLVTEGLVPFGKVPSPAINPAIREKGLHRQWCDPFSQCASY